MALADFGLQVKARKDYICFFLEQAVQHRACHYRGLRFIHNWVIRGGHPVQDGALVGPGSIRPNRKNILWIWSGSRKQQFLLFKGWATEKYVHSICDHSCLMERCTRSSSGWSIVHLPDKFGKKTEKTLNWWYILLKFRVLLVSVILLLLPVFRYSHFVEYLPPKFLSKGRNGSLMLFTRSFAHYPNRWLPIFFTESKKQSSFPLRTHLHSQ